MIKTRLESYVIISKRIIKCIKLCRFDGYNLLKLVVPKA